MQAVIAAGDGSVRVEERPEPQPGPGEVAVRVAGAGLNRADLLQRAGLYPAPPGAPADVPGLEISGTVEAVGEGVHDFAPGDLVLAVTGGGGQAEVAVLPAVQCAPVPAGLDPVEAGGVPEVFVTAHDALRTRAALRAGEHVLVHAAGSGVGTAVVQLAHALGATVTGTARTPEKLERARALGLDHAVVVTDPDPEVLARQIVDAGGPPDVIIDLVGGPYVTAGMRAAAPQGRIVLVGTLAGARADVSILDLMSKRVQVHGTVLRSRRPEEKGAAVAACMQEIAGWLDRGEVRPIVEVVLPLADAARGYELLASDATFGKVILAPGRPG